MCIAGTAVTHHLRNNGGSPCFGEIEVLQDENSCPLTHHKAVAGGIKRTTRPLWIIITARESMHIIECCHSDRSNSFLRSASNHRFGIPTPNGLPCLTD